MPVFDDTAEPVQRTFWVPAGEWTDLLTGETYLGPGFATRTCALGRCRCSSAHGTVVPRVEVTPEHRNTDDLLGLPWTYTVVGDVDGERTFVGFDGRPVRWRAGTQA